MSWEVVYLPEAVEDLRSLDGSQKLLVRKAIEKLRQNPLPETEGGYGKWLGNKGGTKLAGFLKVKLRGAGLRIVYPFTGRDDSARFKPLVFPILYVVSLFFVCGDSKILTNLPTDNRILFEIT